MAAAPSTVEAPAVAPEHIALSVPSASAAERHKPAAADENIAAAPSAPAASASKASEAPRQQPDEQSFELIVPNGVQSGARLQISLPGIDQKIVVTVPPGAVAGKTISFTLSGLPNAKQSEAAVTIQALHRGKSTRKAATTYLPAASADGSLIE